MKISNDGVFLIKKYEGCRLTAYKCPAGVWTIGYGHTAGVVQGMTITQAQADTFLRQDLEKFEKLVEKYDNTYHWSQNEFDALVSFAYNIGNIDQLTANGTRSKELIARKIPEYVKSGGKTLSGLVKRRKDEQDLFLEGKENNMELLKVGSKGDAVKELQKKLSVIGYNPGSADGIFGSNTKKAVIAFQKDAGLSQDGIVGSKTEAAMDEIKVYSLREHGNQIVSLNFKVKEFACQDGSDTVVIHSSFIRDKLQQIRTRFGVPVVINSGYRTPSHNKKVGGSSNSFHIKGRAFDIVVKGKPPVEVARYAASIGIKGVIQYSWGIHIDSRSQKYYAVNNGKKEIPVAVF